MIGATFIRLERSPAALRNRQDLEEDLDGGDGVATAPDELDGDVQIDLAPRNPLG
jgi:hypothetical protein